MEPKSNAAKTGWSGKFLLYVIVVAAAAGLILGLSAIGSPPQPDTNVKVSSFQPSGQVSQDNNITVKFSNDLVPPDSLDKMVLNPPLVIEPPLAGVARWIDKDVIRFFPDDGLAPATTYQVKVQSKDAYVNGNRINEPRSFTFSTPPLEVNFRPYVVMPVGEENRDAVRIRFTLDFNYLVDPEEVQKYVEVTGLDRYSVKRPGFVVEGESVSMRAPRRRVSLSGEEQTDVYTQTISVITEPIVTGKNYQSYEIRVKKGLTCRRCGNYMPADKRYVARVAAITPLVVNRLYPHASGTTFDISLDLSTPVDVDEIKGSISIDPAIDFNIRLRPRGIDLLGEFISGETYTVTLKKGIASISGQILQQEFSSTVVIPQLPPSLKFTSNGMFLPAKGSGNVSVESVNIDTMVVEIEQVFENNLVYYLYSVGGYCSNTNALGRRIYYRDFPLNHQSNKVLPSTIDMSDITGDSLKGIFVVSIRDKQQRWTGDSRKIMLTDIGISARMADNYLLVWTNSLETTLPISKATVSLWSQNNQLLVSGETDARGVVIFDNLKAKIEGFDPYVITVSHKDDMSYVKFSECLLPTEDFDVKGRPYVIDGYESFLYPDRGIYRPGETAHIVSIVRGAKGSLPPKFPYLLVVNDPQGREFKTHRVNEDTTPLTAMDLDIPDFAPTGRYTVLARIGDDYIIGRAEFLVEEFVPDKIKVSLTSSKEAYAAGEEIDIEAQGKYYFGPPAKQHRVSGSIEIEADVFRPAAYSSYSFTSRNREFAKNTINLADTVLDDEGRFKYSVQLPELMRAPSALKAVAYVQVSETGGRAVAAYRSFVIHPYQRYLGLRLDNEGYVKPGETVSASVMALDADAKPVAAEGVKAYLYRVIYNTMLKQDQSGYYRYVSERTRSIVDSTVVSVDAQGAKVSFVPNEYGQYEIEAVDGKDGHAAAVQFYVSGWGYAPWSMENPDRIELGLDRDKYAPGSTARIQVRAPFPGKLLLTIERERVLDVITIDMPENTAEIDLPVKQDYFPNAYISATLIRPAGQVKKHSPARAFGMAPIKLALDNRTLPITIEAPDVIKPNSPMSMRVKVDGAGKRKLTVALVDAGIIQLTDYTTPDPLTFFYGQRRPYLRAYDMYTFVYPEVERAESHLVPGGGAKLAAARMRHLNPISAKRIKPVALWSGLVETDNQGVADLKFNIPQFSGKLVAMVVAVDNEKFGNASAETTVRDNIVIQESFPRFTAPNDEIKGLVNIFNNTGNVAPVTIKLDLDGPAVITGEAAQTLTLQNGAEGDVVFPIKTKLWPGKITCRLTAFSGADTARVEFEMPNRPVQPIKTLAGSGVLSQAGSATFTLPGDWVPNTEQFVIRTSSLAAVSFVRNIEYLLGYPYGCVEQTTSRLFPLLYFDDLARFVRKELIGSKGSDYFIQEGIQRLSSMALSNGLFAFWPGGTKGYDWTSIYATHFLVEATKAGYYVDEKMLNRALDYTEKVARGKSGQDADNSRQIYAALVLGKAGRLENRIINDVKRFSLTELPTYSRFQLAGVIAMSGDLETARTLIPAEIQTNLFEPETGDNFNSGVRTDAILLDVLLEVDPQNAAVAVLAQSLMERSRLGRWYSTQDNAFALMALGKFFKGREGINFTGTVSIQSDSTYRIDTASFAVTRTKLAGRDVTVTIDGDGPCFYYWQSSGISTEHGVEEFNRGIRVQRTYLNENGQSLDPASVTLGDRIICKVEVETPDKVLHNVVVNDLLPAGVEIENPRLKTSPALSWIPEKGEPIDRQDIRDDRVLLFTDLYPKRPVVFYYSVRAISAGQFIIPPVAAECMYNPLIAGAASTGYMTIKRVGEL